MCDPSTEATSNIDNYIVMHGPRFDSAVIISAAWRFRQRVRPIGQCHEPFRLHVLRDSRRAIWIRFEACQGEGKSACASISNFVTLLNNFVFAYSRQF